MFPLGTVLMPSMVLPLHVFEPRYRQLVQDCLAARREFGVVLIERGSEVGGGDVRTDVGTVARIVEAHEMPDGRWAIGAVGAGRIRIERWLEDDPYPRAEVEPWEDDDGASTDPELADRTVAALRRVLALAAELGDRVADATRDLSDDLVLRSFQVAALSPLGPLDRQALLGTPTTAGRYERLIELLADEESVLLSRMRLQDDGTPDA
jgi:Lon protease-like protein